jgi:hypothetical protein
VLNCWLVGAAAAKSFHRHNISTHALSIWFFFSFLFFGTQKNFFLGSSLQERISIDFPSIKGTSPGLNQLKALSITHTALLFKYLPAIRMALLFLRNREILSKRSLYRRWNVSYTHSSLFFFLVDEICLSCILFIQKAIEQRRKRIEIRYIYLFWFCFCFVFVFFHLIKWTAAALFSPSHWVHPIIRLDSWRPFVAHPLCRLTSDVKQVPTWPTFFLENFKTFSW